MTSLPPFSGCPRATLLRRAAGHLPSARCWRRRRGWRGRRGGGRRRRRRRRRRRERCRRRPTRSRCPRGAWARAAAATGRGARDAGRDAGRDAAAERTRSDSKRAGSWRGATPSRSSSAFGCFQKGARARCISGAVSARTPRTSRRTRRPSGMAAGEGSATATWWRRGGGCSVVGTDAVRGGGGAAATTSRATAWWHERWRRPPPRASTARRAASPPSRRAVSLQSCLSTGRAAPAAAA